MNWNSFTTPNTISVGIGVSRDANDFVKWKVPDAARRMAPLRRHIFLTIEGVAKYIKFGLGMPS